ncbi:MAG: bifunctional UDP-N-acetylmuramoyl-tripeptide:D-alanyl-D-alanine ligase/alanine racemase [Candidatus Symbiothrix sp.]|jgi:alanine racemase|nr:bifunctional UDP-N-acetylmuramoyl-tripeptide:D-alanyl-D-alanine ligase/alanine racemase [Candidatus Symbiothrix sp.]
MEKGKTKYSIGEIAAITGAETAFLPETEIKILLTDSRSLTDPAVTLFFALVTAHNDGHKYIGELYGRGVRYFAVQHLFDDMDEMREACFLRVPDTLSALQQLAAFHRKQFNIPVTGITGSNGKTVVKEWLYQLLHDRLTIVRSPRSYNSQTGVPLSVWQLNGQTEWGIFEAGISLPDEMQRLESIILPTSGIFTTIGDAHQENFSSREEKCLEKLQLFDHLSGEGKIIYNEDRTLVKYCLEKKGLLSRTFSWSTVNAKAGLFISRIEKGIDHTVIDYTAAPCTGRHTPCTLSIPFTDDASVENAIHCLALILCLYPELEGLPERFERLDPVAMRLDVSKGVHNNTLINDTYNSDINSLSIALDFMSRRSSDHQLKRVLILSDILQSGMVPAAFYRKVAGLVSQKQVEQIIGIGPNLMSHSSLFGMEKEFYPTTESFLDSGRWRTLKDSIILIKGSRKSRFERISEQLEEKAHQTVLEVDLDAVVHNLKYFRSRLNPETKIICMVKAFGYGVGSYELAKTLQERGADYLAVALADEGAELRREGIAMPILVMNPEEHAFNTLFEYGLEPEIYNLNILEAMIREAGRRGILHYPVHVKLDTGMGRLGFNTSDLPLLAEKLNNQPGLTVKSVFSHLAGSDSARFDDYTQKQISRFREEALFLEKGLNYPVMKHILNSAGIERFPEAQMDMVRLGIGLYGISAVDEKALKTVAALKTRILQIREVKENETVGYNRNGVLKRDSRIACLPIGYADGLDRRLGNGNMPVLIRGKKCPLIGNICMDVCMVDVTDCEAEEGDEAIVFGEEITIRDWANQLQTIPYEILTSISPRVKRIYYRE